MSSVFVSSRIRELEAERETAKETLVGLGFGKVVMSEEIPGGSRSPRESLLREIDNSQILVLILWKEYSVEVLEEFERAKKAKIPVLMFVKRLASDWGESRDPEVQKFVDSVSDYTWKPFRGLEEFRSVLKTSVMAELCEHLRTPFLSHSTQDLFALGEDIARSARSRVVLLARSLILVTGPRPYLSDAPFEYERSHYACLMKLVEESKEGRIKFSCSYIVGRTRKVLEDFPELKEYARDRLVDLFNNSCANEPQSAFTIGTPSPDWDPQFTFIVGDDRFAIWFKDPSDTEICPCVSSEDKKIATALIHIFENVCQKKPLETLLSELRLAIYEKEEPTTKKGWSVSRIVEGLEGKK